MFDRTRTGLSLKKGRAGTLTHDDKRHKTTSLVAALNVLDGTVIGRNMQRSQPEGAKCWIPSTSGLRAADPPAHDALSEDVGTKATYTRPAKVLR